MHIFREPQEGTSGMRKERVIMHLDMDAFFASVEQQVNPRLRGKPIAVCGSKRRSVVTAASYEARPYGVKAGMPTNLARKVCPQLILVETDIPKYVDTSMRILSIFRDFTPKVEVYSIDEAFLDITGSLLLFSGAENIAGLIKERIREELGLTCSIGIAPNKLMAKLASEMKKPDGLMVITSEDIPIILKRLPVKEMPGIGEKLACHLASMGIQTCKELGVTPVSMLTRRFGIIGERLHKMGQGIDDSPVVPPEESPDIKSVGHSMTLDQDISGREEIKKYILQLSDMVGRRLRKNGYRGRTVTLTLRFMDFHTLSKQFTIKTYINESQEICRTACLILHSIRLRQPVRLVGVRVSNLFKDCKQLSLFPQYRKRGEILAVMDRVNDRYGEFALTFAALLNHLRYPRVISPYLETGEEQ
ncbi:MAG: DNA polymerase IV [Thermodesulfobacteriota bacterium]|nr:DNA polymerase IV [Thermodesulfobacteriota bacterium]